MARSVDLTTPATREKRWDYVRHFCLFPGAERFSDLSWSRRGQLAVFNEELDVLYEKGPCLVVNKPAALPTQAPSQFDSLEKRVREFYLRRERKDGNIYLGVPHRLDRPVSGAIVFARNVRAARRLSEQFERREVKKVYWACTEGDVTPETGSWNDFLLKINNEARVIVVGNEDPGARKAALSYRRIGTTEVGSLLEISLETGRMHQIRVQAASRGFPLVGDKLYGAATQMKEGLEDPRMMPIALHACELGFVHPMTKEPVTVRAPLPGFWDVLKLKLF